MTSRTAERLRDLSTAMGETIPDVPELLLPAVNFAGARRPRAQWLAPALAATTVLALAASALVVRHELAGRPANPAAGKHHPVGVTEPIPSFLVTVQDGQAYVRGTLAGHVLWKIPPPVKGMEIAGLASPSNQFTAQPLYLAGEVIRKQGTQLVFFRQPLGKGERPGRAREVPGIQVTLPPTIAGPRLLSNIPLAISPDGTELAYVTTSLLLAGGAHRPAALTIRNVLSGGAQSWFLPPAKSGDRTEISEVSWGPGGQLLFTASIGGATVSHGVLRVKPGSNANANVIMMLDTRKAGTSLLADSRLISAGNGRRGPVGAVFADGGKRIVVQLNLAPGHPKLVVISVATGQVIKTLLRGPQAAQSAPMAADGDDVLFAISPKHVRISGHYLCGHLAVAQPKLANVFGLPFPEYCDNNVSVPSLLATW